VTYQRKGHDWNGNNVKSCDVEGLQVVRVILDELKRLFAFYIDLHDSTQAAVDFGLAWDDRHVAACADCICAAAPGVQTVGAKVKAHQRVEKWRQPNQAADYTVHFAHTVPEVSRAVKELNKGKNYTSNQSTNWHSTIKGAVVSMRGPVPCTLKRKQSSPSSSSSSSSVQSAKRSKLSKTSPGPSPSKTSPGPSPSKTSSGPSPALKRKLQARSASLPPVDSIPAYEGSLMKRTKSNDPNAVLAVPNVYFAHTVPEVSRAVKELNKGQNYTSNQSTNWHSTIKGTVVSMRQP
jgi:hypothetical protein